GSLSIRPRARSPPIQSTICRPRRPGTMDRWFSSGTPSMPPPQTRGRERRWPSRTPLDDALPPELEVQIFRQIGSIANFTICVESGNQVVRPRRRNLEREDQELEAGDFAWLRGRYLGSAFETSGG